MRFVNQSTAHRTKPIHAVLVTKEAIDGICGQLPYTDIIMFNYLFCLRIYKISPCSIGSHTDVTITT